MPRSSDGWYENPAATIWIFTDLAQATFLQGADIPTEPGAFAAHPSLILMLDTVERRNAGMHPLEHVFSEASRVISLLDVNRAHIEN